jgi:hypothetical protein
MTAPATLLPTSAELERAAVHDAKAALAGKDECTCRVCRKVAAALEAERTGRWCPV